MKCKDCKFWQGTRHSAWGDCYRVCAKLEPNLWGCQQAPEDEESDGVMVSFNVPFDPHDLKEYWTHHPYIHMLYEEALYVAQVDEFLRVERVKGVGFIQTHKEYTCEKQDYQS